MVENTMCHMPKVPCHMRPIGHAPHIRQTAPPGLSSVRVMGPDLCRQGQSKAERAGERAGGPPTPTKPGVHTKPQQTRPSRSLHVSLHCQTQPARGPAGRPTVSGGGKLPPAGHMALWLLALTTLGLGPAWARGEEVCNTSQYQCATGHCIPEAWMCDGEADCDDRTDELNCAPGEISTCQTEEFRCSTGLCIPLAWQCDGEVDCPGSDGKEDGLDEWDDLCNNARCDIGEFQCHGEGNCIPQDWTCDGHADCVDGSDETICNVTCSEEEFQCLNSDCIQVRWKCDGERDCADGSDETSCDGRSCDALDQFTCTSGMCVSNRWRCDGEMDCDDGSDEHGCKRAMNSSTECGKDSFMLCANNEDCIHKEWACDGDRDCPDGSDEDDTLCGPVTGCGQDQFRCDNGDCIPGHLRCSGGVECTDGTDEMGCSDKQPVAGNKCDAYTEFDCGPGKACLPRDRVCDLKNDCGSWEDEPRELCGTKKNECDTNNGGCDQLCINTADGYFCDCKPGFQLSASSTCVDVDECQMLGSCSQNCQNFNGSFTCSCRAGYRQEPGRTSSCRVAQGRVGLLFSHQSDIRLTDTLGRGARAVVEDTRSAAVLDFHYEAKQVFWVDSIEKRVYRSEMLEGKKGEESPIRKLLVEGSVGQRDGIAVDWVHNNLYWTDSVRQTISVTDWNGKYAADVVTERLQKPRSLALHPKKGWMFWSDYGDQPRIEKSGMDGSSRVELVTENVMWPNSITLDLVQERLYWVDAKLHLVGSVGLDGTRPNIFSEPSSRSALQHPVSVSVLEDWIYWTEWNQNGSTIFKANKFDGSNLTKIVESVHRKPMSVSVWHAFRQPPSPSVCHGRTLPCSHLCVPVPSLPRVAGSLHPPASRCLCPRDHLLGRDRATCRPLIPLAIQEIMPLTTEDQPTMPKTLETGGRDQTSTPRTEEEDQEIVAVSTPPSLKDAVARLKMEREQRNLYTGLVIGLVTGVGILSLLVGLLVWRRCGQPGNRSPGKLDGRGTYTTPRAHGVHTSESEVPLQRGSPESDVGTV